MMLHYSDIHLGSIAFGLDKVSVAIVGMTRNSKKKANN